MKLKRDKSHIVRIFSLLVCESTQSKLGGVCGETKLTDTFVYFIVDGHRAAFAIYNCLCFVITQHEYARW